MVPRARRPTRPARERASLHPCGAGREKKGGREATGRSAPGARVGGRLRCVCARGGAPQGAEESEKRGVDRKGSGWEGGSSPPSPHPPRLPFARLLPWGFGGRHRPPGRAARGDPRPPPRRVARDRRGDLPARLSRPTSPPRPSRFGSEGSGGGPSPPTRASVSGAGHAPPFATAPPRGASGASRDGWRGGGGGSPVGPLARPVAFPPPALDRFLPGRRSSAPGPPPPRRSPRPVLRARGLSSVVRPALSLSFPPSPPPVCPLPARSPASRRSLPYRPRWREGGPGRGCGARATGGGGGGVWGLGEKRAAPGREREVSARLRGHGGGLVGRWPWLSRVAVGPAPGRGPASRAGSAEAPRAAAGRGRRACRSVVGAAAASVGRSVLPPRLARLSLSRYLARPGAEV